MDDEFEDLTGGHSEPPAEDVPPGTATTAAAEETTMPRAKKKAAARKAAKNFKPRRAQKAPSPRNAKKGGHLILTQARLPVMLKALKHGVKDGIFVADEAAVAQAVIARIEAMA